MNTPYTLLVRVLFSSARNYASDAQNHINHLVTIGVALRIVGPLPVSDWPFLGVCGSGHLEKTPTVTHMRLLRH